MGLALDERFRGLALGIQRVELLVKSFLGAFARVDGATQWRGRRCFRLARDSHGDPLAALAIGENGEYALRNRPSFRGSAS
jgi:hypothetical protein